MEVYLNPVKYCKTPTGHPKGYPCCKFADYDDTALGTGTLTVHPWRAGPDCGKLLYIVLCSYSQINGGDFAKLFDLLRINFIIFKRCF